MHNDPKTTAICEALRQVLQDMAAHGYRKIEVPWEMKTIDDSKVVDRGMLYVERQEDGAYVVRITDIWTGSPKIE